MIPPHDNASLRYTPGAASARPTGWGWRVLAGLAVAAVIGFAGLLVQSARQPSPHEIVAPPPQEYHVTVDPVVPDTRVWLGPTSDIAVPPSGTLVLYNLPEGEQDLLIRAPGYLPFTRRVWVPEGRGETTARLVAQRGDLHLQARPGTHVVARDAQNRTTDLGRVPGEGMLQAEGLLPLGNYTLSLIHADCQPLQVDDVAVRADAPARLNPRQIPWPAELQLVSTPPGATVRIGGAARGTTPLTLTDLPSEEELLVLIELADHVRVEQRLRLRPRESRTLEVGPLVPVSGEVSLRLHPADLPWEQITVVVDGTRVSPDDQGRIGSLAVGERRVVVTHPDYEPATGPVRVEARRTAAIELTLIPKPARVHLVGGPPGLVVSLNDQSVVPRDSIVEIPVGQESVLQVEAPLHFAQTRSFNPGANATEIWELQLERRRSPRPGREHENSLGQRFAPVPGTRVLFATWETREQDYARFVAETDREWEHPSAGPDHPAVNASWDDAQAFCEWLTDHERADGWLSADQSYRLPTDTEWSLAVGLPYEPGDSPAAKDSQIDDHYPWGDQWPPPRGVGNYGKDLDVEAFEYTSPVGTFAPNTYGLYDLGGNVWEWVEDFWREGSRNRVLRGASFAPAYPDDILLSSFRLYLAPNTRFDYIGFRLVLDPGPNPPAAGNPMPPDGRKS